MSKHASPFFLAAAEEQLVKRPPEFQFHAVDTQNNLICLVQDRARPGLSPPKLKNVVAPRKFERSPCRKWLAPRCRCAVRISAVRLRRWLPSNHKAYFPGDGAARQQLLLPPWIASGVHVNKPCAFGRRAILPAAAAVAAAATTSDIASMILGFGVLFAQLAFRNFYLAKVSVFLPPPCVKFDVVLILT